MEYGDIPAKVLQIVMEQEHVDSGRPFSSSQPLEEQGYDELSLIEIIMQLEETFGIEINDEDANRLTTVDHMITYIQERKS